MHVYHTYYGYIARRNACFSPRLVASPDEMHVFKRCMIRNKKVSDEANCHEKNFWPAPFGAAHWWRWIQTMELIVVRYEILNASDMRYIHLIRKSFIKIKTACAA
jgi:hypothetical protein